MDRQKNQQDQGGRQNQSGQQQGQPRTGNQQQGQGQTSTRQDQQSQTNDPKKIKDSLETGQEQDQEEQSDTWESPNVTD